jgi:hypothetical protein
MIPLFKVSSDTSIKIKDKIEFTMDRTINVHVKNPNLKIPETLSERVV